MFLLFIDKKNALICAFSSGVGAINGLSFSPVTPGTSEHEKIKFRNELRLKGHTCDLTGGHVHTRLYSILVAAVEESTPQHLITDSHLDGGVLPSTAA